MVDFIMRMLPYWFLGLFMIYGTIKSGNKDLLKFDGKAFRKWAAFIFFLTIYRILIFHFCKDYDLIKSQTSAIADVPWQASLMVFWEDMSFVVPLVLMSRMMEGHRFSKFINYAALAFMMASFMSGHIYQGLPAAAAISLYIPVSLSRGQKIGFTTVILCHMLYDFSTIMAIKMALSI